MNLTESEKQAKEFFLKLICDGTKYSCEDMLNTQLPNWYDENKFKYGQEFCKENIFLIMDSLATGVISAFSDVRSLTILDSTGKSSTAETARKRYVSTILHFLNWFHDELAPGSEVHKSLDRVRKAHVVNSKASKLKGFGEITQFELVLTGFGFYGFSFLRPDLTGIHFKTTEEKENFIHMWAILTRMVGVKDEFNICLLPTNTLEIVGRMLIRYILIPDVQMEYPIYQKMVKALTEGLGSFILTYSYETQIFYSKMFIGVPGYQYSSNFDNEILSETKILNDDDILKLNEALKMHMGENYVPITKDIPLFEDDPKNIGQKRIAKFINYENDWKYVLNSEHFYNLSFGTKNIIRIKIFMKNLYKFSLGKYILTYLYNKGVTKMKNFLEENKKIK